MNITGTSHELARVVLARSNRVWREPPPPHTRRICLYRSAVPRESAHLPGVSGSETIDAIVWTAAADETTTPQLRGFVRFFITGVVIAVRVRDLRQDVRLLLIVLVGSVRRCRPVDGDRTDVAGDGVASAAISKRPGTRGGSGSFFCPSFAAGSIFLADSEEGHLLFLALSRASSCAAFAAASISSLARASVFLSSRWLATKDAMALGS